MNLLSQLYRFLGSVYFAIILITAVTLFVIAGTFIEAKTGSHQQAAFLTYGNPFFTALLFGFFINILLSALLRWPFQTKHIPFLITHLGLLMIITGGLIKGFFGLQGNLGVIEGSGSQVVFFPNTHAINIEQRNISHNHLLRDTEKHFKPFPQLKIHVAKIEANAVENLSSWIKGNVGVIAGIQPFPVYQWKEVPEKLLASTRVKFPNSPDMVWEVFAGHVSDFESIAEKAYVHNVVLLLKNATSHQTIIEIPLKQALQKEIALDKGSGKVQLLFNYSKINGFDAPELHLDIVYEEKQYSLSIPLQGSKSLMNFNAVTPYLGSVPFIAEIHRKHPTIVFLKDKYGDQTAFVFGKCGQLFVENFPRNKLPSMYMYDNGYGGYSTQMALPVKECLKDRTSKENLFLQMVSQQLEEDLRNNKKLSQPLQIWKNACTALNENFCQSFLEFLVHWHNAHGWLYPQNVPLNSKLEAIIQKLDWNSIPNEHKVGCFWLDNFFASLEPQLEQGKSVVEVLQKSGWPLPLEISEAEDVLDLCTQQIFSTANFLPNVPEYARDDSIKGARLFSAYLRTHGIHLSKILQTEWALNDEVEDKDLFLECPITTDHKAAIPLQKLEDNVSLVTLVLQENGKSEFIQLLYDRYGAGLKWPALNGSYLMRFQPATKEIPYRVRLRQARQVNYPHSSQPYSYEADLIFTDLRTGTPIEKTISMNNVHETWDGYRFYLANIAPSEEGAVKRIQLVVNHDPAKYWLTYPGALLLTMGVILLFWFRK